MRIFRGGGGEIRFILYLFSILLGGIRIPRLKFKIKSFLAAVGRGGHPQGPNCSSPTDVCLSACLLVWLSAFLLVCLSACLLAYLFACLLVTSLFACLLDNKQIITRAPDVRLTR